MISTPIRRQCKQKGTKDAALRQERDISQIVFLLHSPSAAKNQPPDITVLIIRPLVDGIKERKTTVLTKSTDER